VSRGPANPASSAVYLFCIAVLFVCLAALGWQVRQLRHAPQFHVAGVDPRGVDRLFSTSLESAAGGSLTPARLGAKYVVVFVFTSADCSACLPEMESLARIEATRKDIRVVGILAYGNRDEARQTQESFGFKFPILIDPGGRIVSELRLPKTPWKLVINVPARDVIYQDPPSVTAEEREAFFQRVTRLGYF
jgi:peroxiredoxin